MMFEQQHSQSEHIKEQNDLSKIGHRIEHLNTPTRIDAYLAKTYPFLSRAKWQKRIWNGDICISSENSPTTLCRKVTYKLKKYDQIWYYQREQPLKHSDIVQQPIEVLYDDGDICVFAKPPHMVVHPVGAYGKNSFVNHIQNMGYQDCAPVHRIDRETSGILVCARTSKTRAQISKLFREGAIQKRYFAITKGNTPVPDHFEVSSPIGKAENSAIRLKLWVNGANAIHALTEFHTLARAGEYHLFSCIPKTGRTNQIRIHLASVGQWIVGDKMYHPNEDVFLEFHEKGYTDWVKNNVLTPRHFLHNAGIFIPGFMDDFIESKMPEDMNNFIQSCGLAVAKESRDLACAPVTN